MTEHNCQVIVSRLIVVKRKIGAVWTTLALLIDVASQSFLNIFELLKHELTIENLRDHRPRFGHLGAP